MAKKRENSKNNQNSVEQEIAAAPEKLQKLTVGVNFCAEGETEETRVEAGIIEQGTLPPAFERVLRERRQLFDVKYL